MTHRAETILDAVTESLTGLATTGARVERAQRWAVESVPALTIHRGDDTPTDTGRRLGFQDRQLEVIVTAYVKSLDNHETDLNQIAAEVYGALFADVTQGLAFVLDTHWLGDGRPEVSTETETRTASMQMSYRITYRHSITTPES